MVGVKCRDLINSQLNTTSYLQYEEANLHKKDALFEGLRPMDQTVQTIEENIRLSRGDVRDK